LNSEKSVKEKLSELVKKRDFLAGKTLQGLQTAMGSEETYVNIHTSEDPDGEIRGQIKVSGANATNADTVDTNSTAGMEEE